MREATCQVRTRALGRPPVCVRNCQLTPQRARERVKGRDESGRARSLGRAARLDAALEADRQAREGLGERRRRGCAELALEILVDAAEAVLARLQREEEQRLDHPQRVVDRRAAALQLYAACALARLHLRAACPLGAEEKKGGRGKGAVQGRERGQQREEEQRLDDAERRVDRRAAALELCARAARHALARRGDGARNGVAGSRGAEHVGPGTYHRFSYPRHAGGTMHTVRAMHLETACIYLMLLPSCMAELRQWGERLLPSCMSGLATTPGRTAGSVALCGVDGT